MHIYKCIQSHIIVLHQHVSVTPVTINRMFCIKYTINIQIIVQKCMVTRLLVNTKWCYNTYIIHVGEEKYEYIYKCVFVD